MDQWLTVVGGAAFLLVGFAIVGGPVFLVDWSRKRRQAAIERQILLTDALDRRLGAIVAPVVKKPLLGPWEIRIAVPLLRSTTAASILSVVDDVFSDRTRLDSSAYRVVLRAKPGFLREARASQTTWALTRPSLLAANGHRKSLI